MAGAAAGGSLPAGCDGDGGGSGKVGCGGVTAQPAASSSAAKPASAVPARDNPAMWLILLEAAGAGLILVLIVWWTMFSGRSRGERRGDDDPPR
jgi:hypothetical protein